MIGFLVNRIAYSLAVLVAVASAVFGLIHLSGDPLAGFTAPGASPDEQAVIRERFGLDEPIPVQYLTYLVNAVRGDFGDSWRAQRPAMDTVLARVPATLALAAAALVIALAVGLPLAIAAATHPTGPAAWLAGSVSVMGQAVPGFFLGTVMILVFAVRLQWLPSSGGDGLRSLVLPAVTLAMYPAAIITRLLRVSLSDALGADYVRTAASKGMSRRAIVTGHALRNAVLPTLAYVGLQAGFLAGGAVVIEGVFAYPGIGHLALGAVADRDLPVVQAVALVVATLIVSVNLVVDLIARLIDPRLRIVARHGVA